jgi:hypothetical protein
MKGKTIAIISLSIGGAAIGGYFLYNAMKNKKATEAHVSEMYETSKAVKSTAFDGLNAAEVYDRFKNTLDSEVKRMTKILSKGKSATAAEQSEFGILFTKALDTYSLT